MDSNFHGLPPLKRFRLIQQQQQQQQQRDTAVSPSRLPAKKRKESRISPSFREPTHTATTYCLPAKKRVWALLPDFIADVSLQAKKGVGSHQPDIIADEAVTISLPFDLNSTTSEEGIPLVDGTNESLTNASQDENEDAAAAADDDDDDDDGTVCAICQSTDGDPTDPIVFCDGCDLMVHATCYGDPLVKAIPEGDWFCSQCLVSTSESNKGRSPSFSCCLCPTKGGALKPTVDGRWAHLVCALLVPEVFFADAEGREGIDCSKVPKKRWEEKCYVCKSRSGCAVECSESKCHLAFHVTCGLKEDLCIEYREVRKQGAIVAGFCKDHTELWKRQQQTGKFKIVAREEHMK